MSFGVYTLFVVTEWSSDEITHDGEAVKRTLLAPRPIAPHAIAPHAIAPHAIAPHAITPHPIAPHLLYRILSFNRHQRNTKASNQTAATSLTCGQRHPVPAEEQRGHPGAAQPRAPAAAAGAATAAATVGAGAGSPAAAPTAGAVGVVAVAEPGTCALWRIRNNTRKRKDGPSPRSETGTPWRRNGVTTHTRT